MSDATQGKAIDPHKMLPDLLREYPQVRPVFDRYGLRGCGGAHGPAESIEYFARAHGVELDRLLDELRAAAASREVSLPVTGQERSEMDELADRIYRRFFKGGLAIVLTAGATWGALLLARIAMAHDFAAISIHDINAHGHAQIFGWVGLFVMGFAYQAFPRMKHTHLWRPDLANLTFYLMLAGIIARVIGEPLHEWPLLRGLAVGGALAEIVAIGLFILIILNTFRQSGKPIEVHEWYILASLGFFVIQAVYELGLLVATTAVNTLHELLPLVATYQSPLRDLQIHGFAMMIILGVGLRMFPALFGFHSPGVQFKRTAFFLLLVSIVGEAAFFILYRLSGERSWIGPMYLCVLVLAASSLGLTWRWGLLARPTERDRSVKFIRAAIVWLHVSMVMLVAAPLYIHVYLPAVGSSTEGGRLALEIGFSHAYYGAVRHAITVGFISLTILGMAGKVVPTLMGVDVRRLRPLWLPFALVNTGCAMRVFFQMATDRFDWAYPLSGASGILEVTGIAIWGVHIVRIMHGWEPADVPAEGSMNRITADDKIGLVVARYPHTLPILIDRGFKPLSNPIARRTVALAISIRQAAAHQGVDLDELLDALNRCAFGQPEPVREASGPQ